LRHHLTMVLPLLDLGVVGADYMGVRSMPQLRPASNGSLPFSSPPALQQRLDLLVDVGKQKSVTPTTDSPAPRSKRGSVIERTSDTTRCGAFKPSADLLTILRVEGVDEAVAEEVQAHHGEHDRCAGEDGKGVRCDPAHDFRRDLNPN
jgi:hypothetical protein